MLSSIDPCKSDRYPEQKSKLLIFIFLLISFSPFLSPANPEGSKELNTNGTQSTSLYLCNDFATHCTSANGLRTQFATYDASNSAADVDRLYFTVGSTSESVYMGFQGGGLGNNPARHIVYQIREKVTGMIVQAEQSLPTTGAGFISTLAQAQNGPNQLISPPNPANGYDAVIFTPSAAGTYYIEFTVRRNDNNAIYTGTFSMDLFDITVGNPTTLVSKPGRLYSKCWQFSENTNFYGINYIISDDSIITSATFNNMDGGAWVQYCNQTGCGITNWVNDRKSLYHQQALYPQYKIFLNTPDPALFPEATTLGQIVGTPWEEKFCNNGHIIFHISVNKPGNVELQMAFAGGYTTRIMNQVVVVGENLFDWDGLDGAGVSVPNNTGITFTIKYINGLTNLPLYDVEGNTSGFTISLVAPLPLPPATTTPPVYWDDTNISGGTNNSTTGCTTPPCHSWASTGGGWGNLNTVNTWWYNVSTTTAPVLITEYRNPGSQAWETQTLQACENSVGSPYSVVFEANTEFYHWSYTPATGVTIHQTPAGSRSITIDFGPGASSGTLSVYGTNTNCNTTQGPTLSMLVTILPLPLPVVTGPQAPCKGSTGNIYSTQSGKTNYVWSVSSGGNINTGTGTNTISVTWNNAGPQTVFVNYTDNNCTAPTPVSYPVTVKDLPVPLITGIAEACLGSTGNVYTTQAGNLAYTWAVSAGGMIAGGGGNTNSITIDWTSTGPQNVSVTYVDGITNCAAASPANFPVTIKPLPVPGMTGEQSPCQGSVKTYTTESGKLLYNWLVSPGGNIQSGGDLTSPTVTVLWSSTGPQTVKVIYTDEVTNCRAADYTTYNVNVQELPVPTLTGPLSVCIDNPGPAYATETGKNGYTWALVPPTAGNITSGASTSSIGVTWTVLGTHQVTVNYTDPVTGCTAAAVSAIDVTVNTLPVPSISGETDPCTGIDKIYTTQAGVSKYLWTVSSGGTIVSGGDTLSPTITINWTTPGVQTVSVNYTIGTGCTAATPSVFNVLVHQSTPPVISGLNTICELNTATYTTQTGNTNYSWSLSPGGSFSGGTSGSTVVVDWTTAGSRYIEVNFTNNYGCTAPTPTRYNVTVNPLPVTTITQGSGPVCSNGSTTFQTLPDPATTFTWTIVPSSIGTISGGQGSNAISISWLTSGAPAINVTGTKNATGCFTNSSIPVTVNPSPEPVFNPCFDTKTTAIAQKYTLRGASPYIEGQGIFTGTRVSLNASTGLYEFNPLGAGPGAYQVTYTYKNTFQCSYTTPAITINVVSSSFSCGGLLTDVRDGKKYKTALIGGKCWMKENLNYGTIVQTQTTPQSDNCIAEKYCQLADPACTVYGGLYQWDELMAYNSTSENQGLCPPGWHVPTESEWQSLINSISTGITPPADGIAGGFLKDSIMNPGFYARTKGLYYLNNTWAFTNGTPTGALFWTSTTNGIDRAVARGVTNVTPSTSYYRGSRGNAFSVRCTKD